MFDSLEEELAEEFDEPIEIVRQTIDFLVENKMISIDGESNCFMPEAIECTGYESESAERMRRKMKSDKASQCDGDVTVCDGAASHVTQRKEKREDKDNILCSPDGEREPHLGENQSSENV